MKQLLDKTVGDDGQRLFGWSKGNVSIEVGEIETIDL